jgi:hypothetical protein
MRLAVELLDNVDSVNSYTKVSQWDILPGETKDLYFQLVDASKGGLRYIPQEVPANPNPIVPVVRLMIPRNTVITGSINNVRVSSDYSIDVVATQPFAGDASIWKVSFSEAETQVMATGSIQVKVTEGTKVSIARNEFAIRMVPLEG